MSVPTDKNLYESIVKKVKARVDRWPSAYASGMVVKEYKAAMAKLGKPAYREIQKKPDETVGLLRWFKEKWIDITTGKPCGSVKRRDYYPVCRPSIRVTSKTPVTVDELNMNDKKLMVAQKQQAKKKRVQYEQTKTNRKKRNIIETYM